MVTVVITTYKRQPQYIARAINSVIAQTYTDWELIIIDDSPSDYAYRNDVKEIVLSFVHNNAIYYYANEKNSGASFSRNMGIKKARGEYIAFLDDDDEWLPQKIEKQVSALNQTNENVALVYQPYYKIDENTNDKRVVKTILKNGILYEELLQRGNFIGGMSVPLIRKECLEKVGGFDELMHVAEDLDLWIRLAEQYEIISIEEPLVLYYIHQGEQLTTNATKAIEGIERLNDKNKDYLNAHKKVKWKRQISLIKFYVQNGRRNEAIKIWINTARLCPNKIIENTKELIRIIIK